MKILIVDDEVIIRTGLASVIDWEELGLTLLAPAASAEEALHRIPEEKPDIVMTDIRMSGKTGLELVKEAEKMVPDSEFIILTGYDDFTYAQQAVRTNVGDYLLKSSRPDEIVKAVLMAKQRILERQAERSQDFTRQREEQTRFLVRCIAEGELEELKNPIGPAAGWLERLKGEKSGDALQVVLCDAEGWEERASSKALLLFAVENMLNELLPSCVTFRYKGRVAAVMHESRSPGDGRLPFNYHTLIHKIECLLKCRLSFAFGAKVERAEELHQSFRTADYVSGYREWLQEKQFDYEKIAERRGGRMVCTHSEELELSAILLEGNLQPLKAWASRYTENLLADPDMTLESLAASLDSVVLSAFRWLDRTLAAIGKPGLPEDRLSRLAIDPRTSSRDMLFQHLNSIMKSYHNGLTEGQTAYVRRAMAYIEDNLGQNVSLQQVSRQVHLNPSHFSEVFKKETGITFSDYVTRKKMSRAMELLSISPMKVGEIAADVGYEDVKYFSQLFKKNFGKTPSEYREQLQK